jgi:hypothetical protein
LNLKKEEKQFGGREQRMKNSGKFGNPKAAAGMQGNMPDILAQMFLFWKRENIK